jgi:hypothetical protein
MVDALQKICVIPSDVLPALVVRATFVLRGILLVTTVPRPLSDGCLSPGTRMSIHRRCKVHRAGPMPGNTPPRFWAVGTSAMRHPAYALRRTPAFYAVGRVRLFGCAVLIRSPSWWWAKESLCPAG